MNHLKNQNSASATFTEVQLSKSNASDIVHSKSLRNFQALYRPLKTFESPVLLSAAPGQEYYNLCRVPPAEHRRRKWLLQCHSGSGAFVPDIFPGPVWQFAAQVTGTVGVDMTIGPEDIRLAAMAGVDAVT